MRRLAELGAVTLALCVVGCGHSSGTSSTQTTATGSGTATATATATATGTILGTFRIQGGPYPGINRPLSGQIEIHAGGATGHIVATATAVSGHFHAVVAPGRYVIVGKSGRAGGVGCTSGIATTARAGDTVRANVRCDVP